MKLKGIFTKSKIIGQYRNSFSFQINESGIISVLDQLKKDQVNAMIVKSESDLSVLKSQFDQFSNFHDIIQKYRSKQEVSQASSNKLTLKKLAALSSSSKSDEIKERHKKAVEWHKKYQEIIFTDTTLRKALKDDHKLILQKSTELLDEKEQI